MNFLATGAFLAAGVVLGCPTMRLQALGQRSKRQNGKRQGCEESKKSCAVIRTVTVTVMQGVRRMGF